LTTHPLILFVQGRVDRVACRHVQNLLADPAPVLLLNFFGEGVHDGSAHVFGAALHLLAEIVGTPNRDAHLSSCVRDR
jgi:hypothetical protein